MASSLLIDAATPTAPKDKYKYSISFTHFSPRFRVSQFAIPFSSAPPIRIKALTPIIQTANSMLGISMPPHFGIDQMTSQAIKKKETGIVTENEYNGPSFFFPNR